MVSDLFNAFFKNNLLWTEGRQDLILSLLLALIAFFLNPMFSFLALFFVGFLLFFYRNPKRDLPVELLKDDRIIISPADGKVISIESTDEGTQLSIFLSPFNVHINWIPMNGVIQSIEHKPGKFLMAFKTESAELNERNDIVIANRLGSIEMRQIAGLLARRIACWFRANRKVTIGEKYGMIKFGSRVDLFLPSNVVLMVSMGEKVKGGQTILAKFMGVRNAH